MQALRVVRATQARFGQVKSKTPTFRDKGSGRALESREVEGLAGTSGIRGKDTHLQSLTSQRHVQSPWKLRTLRRPELCGAAGSAARSGWVFWPLCLPIATLWSPHRPRPNTEKRPLLTTYCGLGGGEGFILRQRALETRAPLQVNSLHPWRRGVGP